VDDHGLGRRRTAVRVREALATPVIVEPASAEADETDRLASAPQA
jgi:hypothetical protein